VGGTDAVENAMKVAHLNTGRQKIITRYRQALAAADRYCKN
jgi:4-aminobutyrate aminotransferase-like enzyme